MRLLYIGLDNTAEDFAKELLKPVGEVRLKSPDEFMAFIENPDPSFHMVLAGPLMPEVSVQEIAQSVRGILQTAPIFFCHSSLAAGFDRKVYIKNGFTDAFFLPMDNDVFRQALENAAGKGAAPTFRPVRIMDITEDASLPFDLHLFLPSNKKYIHYSSAGYAVGKDRVDKLKKYNVGSIFVPLDQMSTFYNYSAERLRTLTNGGQNMSETERRERMQGAVRDLMTGIFVTSDTSSFDDGKKMMADAGEIVKSYLQKGSESELYSRLTQILGDVGGSYSHLSNVSTIAALFSMATGIGKPDELALAGLFHDLGLSLVPAEIQDKAPEQWTADERKEYERHSEHSVNLLKQRKINLPTSIQTMIFQHHERVDGKGYPTKVGGDKFRPNSQILAIADAFDELTRLVPGVKTLTPEEALMQILADGAFTPATVNSLLKIFKPVAKAA